VDRLPYLQGIWIGFAASPLILLGLYLLSFLPDFVEFLIVFPYRGLPQFPIPPDEWREVTRKAFQKDEDD
jgi:hypothetical protein